MSTVTHLTHSINLEIIGKLFKKFSSRYGHSWNSRHKTDAEWIDCANDWVEELQDFDLFMLQRAVKQAFLAYKDFPPTLGQLIDLCLKESGVPSEEQIIKSMVARDFSHPMVKMIYDRIGSWNLANGKVEEIKAKTRAAYNDTLASFREQPEQAWAKLASVNEELALAPPEPEKIPSPEERRGFKERMAEYQQKLDDAKLAMKGKTYKEFEPNKIKLGHKEFDQAIFDEYKAYLLSIPDHETMTLPVQYIYERMRLIGQRDQDNYLKKAGYVPPKEREGFESPKASDKRNGGPTRVYKSWLGD